MARYSPPLEHANIADKLATPPAKQACKLEVVEMLAESSKSNGDTPFKCPPWEGSCLSPIMPQGQHAECNRRVYARLTQAGGVESAQKLAAQHRCLASGTSRQSFGTMHYTVHSQPCIHIRNVRNPTMQLFLTRLTLYPALGDGKG